MTVDEARLQFDAGGMWVVNLILAAIIFGVALDLRAADFRRVLVAPRAPLIGLVCQFCILPAFTFALTLVIRPEPSIALGMILVASCPGGNLSNFLTHLARGNTPLSLTMTAVSTAAAIVMTPLNFALWGSLHPETRAILTHVRLDFWDVFTTVAVILGIPLTCGLLVARYLPGTAARLHRPFKFGSIAFFLLLVVFLGYRDFPVLRHFLMAVLVAVVLHNAVALASGYGMSRMLGLPERDRRAITLEVGIQNSALGLSLIFAYFDGLGGMVLVAGTWALWHIVAGLGLGTFWAWRPPTDERTPIP